MREVQQQQRETSIRCRYDWTELRKLKQLCKQYSALLQITRSETLNIIKLNRNMRISSQLSKTLCLLLFIGNAFGVELIVQQQFYPYAQKQQTIANTYFMGSKPVKSETYSHSKIPSHQKMKNQPIPGDEIPNFRYQTKSSIYTPADQIYISQKSPISPTRRSLSIIGQQQQNYQLFDNLQTFSTLPGSILVPQKNHHIQSRQFSGIGLYQEVPNIFILNQIYRFHGTILNPRTFHVNRRQYINIVFIEIRSKEQFRCMQELKEYQTQFEVSCKIKKKGRFWLTIFSGQNGRTSTKQRNIVSEQESEGLGRQRITQTAPIVSNVTLAVMDNQMTIMWDSEAPISKIFISQNKSGVIKSMQYKLSNYHTKFIVEYGQFFDFIQTKTSVKISHASSFDNSLNGKNSEFGEETEKLFDAIQHKFSSYQDDLITELTYIPYQTQKGSKVQIKARFNLEIRKQVYVVTPLMEIIKINVGSKDLREIDVPRGQRITFNLNLNLEGPYIIQINTYYGQAVINRPIYVGNCFPLLPDYEDLKEYAFVNDMELQNMLVEYLVDDFSSLKEKVQLSPQKLAEPSPDASLQQERQFLLKLTNLLRMKFKVEDVYLDEQLNDIAQDHADDMRRRDYFSHTDLEGNGPGERAEKANFFGAVGQNLAYSASLTIAHLSLERSAVHLENSVKRIWTRVGIGITKNDTHYIVVYKFSTRDINLYPPTQSEISQIADQVAKFVQGLNPSLRGQDKEFSGAITQWMNSQRSTGIFNYLVQKGFKYSMSWTIFQSAFTPQVKSVLERDPALMMAPTGKTKFGVGVAIIAQGKIEIYIVFY